MMEQSMPNKKKNPYHMLWHTKEGFYIKGNKIVEDIGAENIREYNPLYAVEYAKPNRREQRGAYLDFININYNADGDKVTEDILSFISQYGLLLNDVFDDRRVKEYTPSGVNIRSDKASFSYSVEMPQFISEAKQLKYLVELYTCICTTAYDNENDSELQYETSLVTLLEQFIERHKNESVSVATQIGFDLIKEELEPGKEEPEQTESELEQKIIDVNYIRERIMTIIRIGIRPHIENIHFKVLPDSDIDVPQLGGNLLEAMYFRFYIDILLKFPIKQCRAVECNNIFTVYSDKRQQRRKYCCEACRKRHHKQIHNRINKFGKKATE